MRNNNFITSPKKSDVVKVVDDFVTIIILGENHGYRMKSYGPLPLIKIHNKTLIERQVESIKATFSNFEIILCVGFEATKTINFIKHKFPRVNIRTVENQVHFNSNCCESARLCINNTVNNRIIICGGGVLVLPSQLQMFNINQTSVIAQSQLDDSNFEIGVIQHNKKLEKLSLGIKHKYWTELMCISTSSMIDSFSTILSNPDYKNKFIFEAINDLSEKTNIKVQDNTSNKPIVKIDNIKTLKRIMRI